MFTGKPDVHQYGGQLKWDHVTETDLFLEVSARLLVITS